MCFVFPLVLLIRVQAKDFELTINRDVYIDDKDKIKIVETHIVKNNSTTEYISKKNNEIFIINHIKSKSGIIKETTATAILNVNGKSTTFTVEYSNETATISVEYPRSIGVNDSLTFVLEYQNFGLLENTGALWDLYLSGLSKDSILSNDKQDLIYNTNVYVKNNVLPKLNFALPQPLHTLTTSGGNYLQYVYDLKSITGKSIWLQFGIEQYYKFKITQKANATLDNSFGLQNEYRIILPREINGAEVTQNIFLDKIIPIPSKTELDANGNFFAYFNIPSNQTDDISIEGYAKVGVKTTKITSDNSGTINDYKPEQQISQYLVGSQYWEVNSSEIQAKANELKGSETNVFTIVNNTYNFVINKIDYNEVKRFGINNRQGALATLKSGSGVCMEYSDLFLTLLRAQEIPTRAVFGYGYDPLIDNKSQEAHQWVQVLIPTTGDWLDIDVTWGEMGAAAIGGVLNHFYTHIAINNPEENSEVILSSFGNSDMLELPKYEISAIGQMPENNTFLSQEGLLNKYPYIEYTSFMEFVMKIPRKINELFKNVENREGLSVVLLGAGLILVIVPVSLLLKNNLDFGKKSKNTDAST